MLLCLGEGIWRSESSVLWWTQRGGSPSVEPPAARAGIVVKYEFLDPFPDLLILSC